MSYRKIDLGTFPRNLVIVIAKNLVLARKKFL